MAISDNEKREAYDAFWEKAPQSQYLKFFLETRNNSEGKEVEIWNNVGGTRKYFNLNSNVYEESPVEEYKNSVPRSFRTDWSSSVDVWNHVWYGLDGLRKDFCNMILDKYTSVLDPGLSLAGQWGWFKTNPYYFNAEKFNTVLCRVDEIEERESWVPNTNSSGTEFFIKGLVVTMNGDGLNMEGTTFLRNNDFHPVDPSIAEVFYAKCKESLADFWEFMTVTLIPQIKDAEDTGCPSFPVDDLKRELYPHSVCNSMKTRYMYYFGYTEKYPSESDIEFAQAEHLPLYFQEVWNILSVSSSRMGLKTSRSTTELFGKARLLPILEDLYSHSGVEIPKRIRKFDPDDGTELPSATQYSAKSVLNCFRELSNGISNFISSSIVGSHMAEGETADITTGKCYWYRDALCPDGIQFNACLVRKVESDGVLTKLRGQTITFSNNRLTVTKNGAVEAFRRSLVQFSPETFNELKSMAESALAKMWEAFDGIEYDERP